MRSMSLEQLMPDMKWLANYCLFPKRKEFFQHFYQASKKSCLVFYFSFNFFFYFFGALGCTIPIFFFCVGFILRRGSNICRIILPGRICIAGVTYMNRCFPVVIIVISFSLCTIAINTNFSVTTTSRGRTIAIYAGGGSPGWRLINGNIRVTCWCNMDVGRDRGGNSAAQALSGDRTRAGGMKEVPRFWRN